MINDVDNQKALKDWEIVSSNKDHCCILSAIGIPFSGELRRICEEYQKRIVAIENSKYDIEKEVDKKAYKIDELHIAVSDLRGKL